jgi:hypothetical protein
MLVIEFFQTSPKLRHADDLYFDVIKVSENYCSRRLMLCWHEQTRMCLVERGL